MAEGSMGGDMEKAKERWEKAFQKEMTSDEETMFNWGYVYAINDVISEKAE